MSSDFHVDTEDLLRLASALRATADRVTGAATASPVIDPSPRWAATAAATLAAEAMRRQWEQLGGDVAGTARRIAASAAAYQDADARAAARFRLVR